MTSIKRTFVRTVVALLFSAILLIPRARRLRRSVPVWTAIRIAILAAGIWLIWRGLRSGPGGFAASDLAPGIILVIFAVLVGSRAPRKSVDAVARELNALIVLNGGILICGMNGQAAKTTNIFVGPDILHVLDRDFSHLLEIAVPDIREIVVSEEADGNKGGAWRLEILRKTGGAPPAGFRYEGIFAEHMARVAEKTLHEVWKKGLPVIAP